MIFVTVGTTPFDSLIEVVDAIAEGSTDRILCQIAGGKYIPKHCEYFRFKSDMSKELEAADLIISHGGAGTLFHLLGLGKKVISVPNLERSDKHQIDLIETLAKNNYVIACPDLNKLGRKISTSENTKLRKYEKPECTIATEIAKFIGE